MLTNEELADWQARAKHALALEAEGAPNAGGFIQPKDLAALVTQAARVAELEAERRAIQNDARVLTCVYCGHQYPPGTPPSNHDALTAHIKECPKHPMRKAEADLTLLRNALAGLVGASDKAELEQMELAVRVLPAPEADKIASLNAIHALLATLPNI